MHTVFKVNCCSQYWNRSSRLLLRSSITKVLKSPSTPNQYTWEIPSIKSSGFLSYLLLLRLCTDCVRTLVVEIGIWLVPNKIAHKFVLQVWWPLVRLFLYFCLNFLVTISWVSTFKNLSKRSTSNLPNHLKLFAYSQVYHFNLTT